jgi:diguanylate cyclase (GGDEF)-like protein
MHVDLDWFKQVNDTFGHAAGDHVLVEVGRVLRAATRAVDTVVRVGGDEFVVILPGILSRGLLQRIGGRIVERLSEPIDFEGQPCRISASVGIALSSGGEPPDVERVLAEADRALYESKNAGRGRVTLA